MGGYHELFRKPPCILLDIMVPHCPGYKLIIELGLQERKIPYDSSYFLDFSLALMPPHFQGSLVYYLVENRQYKGH